MSEITFEVTEDDVVVEVHGSDGERLTTLGRILHTTYGPDGMYRLFTAFALVEAGGSTIALGRTTETEVCLLDELRLRRILRRSDSDRDVRGVDVRAWRDDYIERRGGRESPDWRPFDEEVVSGEVPAADERAGDGEAGFGEREAVCRDAVWGGRWTSHVTTSRNRRDSPCGGGNGR